MKTDILAKLLGSSSRLKIIRLFLLNPEEIFSLKAILQRIRVSKEIARREINLLKEIDLIASKSIFIETKDKKLKKLKKKKVQGWKLNPAFPLLRSLKNFILETVSLSRKEILRSLTKTGRLKLIILAGVFSQDENSRVDIFVVGDSIRKKVLENAIKRIEVEVGKELVYAVFNTQEFLYRLGMYDKFIRDILDYPHEKILNKLNV